MNIVWVSETGLIVTANGDDGFHLEDPLSDEPIQWCDEIEELKRIVEDIELNPFKVGDKVRVKKASEGTYEQGTFDSVYYVRNNGSMCIEFYNDGISSCVYTWQDLEAYEASE